MTAFNDRISEVKDFLSPPSRSKLDNHPSFFALLCS